MKTSKILIFDDNKLYRETLKNIFEQTYNVTIVGITGDEDEFMRLLDTQETDIVFMNITDVHKSETVKQTMQGFPYLNTVVLSMYCKNEYLKIMLYAGIKNQKAHEKNTSNSEFERAIMDVMQGKFYFSREMTCTSAA